LLRLLRALVGILHVGGLSGRWVALLQAEHSARAGDLSGVRVLLGASSIFERLVIRSFVTVLVFGVLTAWSTGYPLLLGSFQGGSSNWLLVSLAGYLPEHPPTCPSDLLPSLLREGAAETRWLCRNRRRFIRCVAPGASYDVCAAGTSSNVACSGGVGGWPG
jgi:hypothetical protein